MDPLTASLTFSTIVGLICNFKQERGANNSATRDEFMAYLEHHRHQEIKDLITRTHLLSEEVDHLLHEEHAVIIAKLNNVNSLLATLVSKIDGLSGFARVLVPSSVLSEQAFKILCDFFDSTSDTMEERRKGDRLGLVLQNRNHLVLDDQRFLSDDLITLCRLDLLARDFKLNGDPFYRLTRNAAKFISATRSNQ